MRTFLLATGLVALVPSQGHACSCYFIHDEYLTIESVSVDSVPVADLSAWQSAIARPDDDGTPGFTFAVSGTAGTVFRGWYDPVP